MQQVAPILRKYFFDGGFPKAVSKFRSVRGVPFSMLLTKWGLCLNFNLQPMELLLNIEKYMCDEFWCQQCYKKSLTKQISTAYHQIFTTKNPNGLRGIELVIWTPRCRGKLKILSLDFGLNVVRTTRRSIISNRCADREWSFTTRTSFHTEQASICSTSLKKYSIFITHPLWPPSMMHWSRGNPNSATVS